LSYTPTEFYLSRGPRMVGRPARTRVIFHRSAVPFDCLRANLTLRRLTNGKPIVKLFGLGKATKEVSSVGGLAPGY